MICLGLRYLIDGWKAWNTIDCTDYGVKESETIKDNSHSAVSDDDKVVLNGASFCLPSSVPYKLAVSVAKKRFEIKWVKSG